MSDNMFFKFNSSGKELRLTNFSGEIDLSKISDEKIKKLLSKNIFDAEGDGILQISNSKGVNEVASLWNALKAGASKLGDETLFDEAEIKAFAKEYGAEDIDSLAFSAFFSELFTQKTEPQKPQLTETQVKEAVAGACRETVIGIIGDNIAEAEDIFCSQFLGKITGYYDNRKDDDNKLKISNVQKVLDYQKAGMVSMLEAKEGKLTRRAYYEENKQRIKDMILTRLSVLEASSGISMLDQYRGKYSKQQFMQIINDYVEQLCANADMDKLKDLQKQFVSFTIVEEAESLSNIARNAKEYHEHFGNTQPNNFSKEFPQRISLNNPKGVIPSYWDSAEPITFEEVYKLERGTEYSQYKAERYVLAKKEMETVANAFNRKQQFVGFANSLREDDELSPTEKAKKIQEGFAEFYALTGDEGRSELSRLIRETELHIKLTPEGELDLSEYSTDSAKNKALNTLLKYAAKDKEATFEAFLGDKSMEDYQKACEQASLDILGEDNAQLLSEAMKNDNLSVIQRYTGNASMVGMGITVIGGILCFTPVAPLGAAMVSAGNALAIGGMVTKNALEFTDYATKDVQTAEELSDLTKGLIMDAGGFVVGYGAGKVGLNAFNKLIDKKLVAVFAKEITAGNRMEALKTVFSNPAYLKSFMVAGGTKISADFLISYAGDLAMMGVLDTKDDWRSLLQANLTGILVGMSSSIKDVSGVSSHSSKKPNNSRPLTQEQYGRSALGKDVTIKLSSGAEIQGKVTEVRTENGVTQVKVGETFYSTDAVARIVEPPKAKSSAHLEEDVTVKDAPEVKAPTKQEEDVTVKDASEVKAPPKQEEVVTVKNEPEVRTSAKTAKPTKTAGTSAEHVKSVYTPEHVKYILESCIDCADRREKYLCDFLFDNLDKLDYENMDRHIENLKTLIYMTANCKKRIFENGYFFSKEGADAFDILAKRYSSTPEQSGYVAPLSTKLLEFDYNTVLIAERRGLSADFDNENRIRRLTAMSDEEYSAHRQSVDDFWANSPRDYDSYLAELKELLAQDFDPNDRYYKRFFKENVNKDDIAAQLEFFKAYKDLGIYADKYSKIEIFRVDVSLETIPAVKKVFEAIKGKEEISVYQIVDLVRMTNAKNADTLVAVLKNPDMTLSKFFEICEKEKDALAKGEISASELTNRFNQDPFIRTTRAIKANSDQLRLKTPPTALNPQNIDASSLALVHMTNYEPANGVILSTRDKLGGSRNSVHFTLNHAVTSHRAGDWDNCKMAIIMPFDATRSANTPGKFIEGMPNDLYTNGSVKIPEGAVIVKHNPNIPEGEIKISDSPDLKGVKVVEVSSNVHEVVPTVLESIGYTHMQADAPVGQFNFGEMQGRTLNGVCDNYKAWEKFCTDNGMKPTRHTGSPGGIAERLIEDVAKLCQNKSGWKYDNCNFKARMLKNIQALKYWQQKGYFVSYDLNKFEEIVRDSSSPKIALKRIEKELGFKNTGEYKDFYFCSVDFSMEIYNEWLRVCEDPVMLRNYIKEHEM